MTTFFIVEWSRVGWRTPKWWAFDNEPHARGWCDNLRRDHRPELPALTYIHLFTATADKPEPVPTTPHPIT